MDSSTATPTPADKVRRVIARRADQVNEATLPTRLDAQLVTLTLDELHDIVYTATRQACRLTHTPDRDARLARVTAERARAAATGHDGFHLGPDPRPAT